MDVSHLRRSAGGIPRYVRGLTSALSERNDVSVIKLGDGPREGRGIRKKLLTAQLDLAWYPVIVRRRAARAKADVLHCPAPRGPLRRGRPPLVVTLHDLVPFRFPETMTRWSLLYARATHRRMLMAADRIICISDDTANDLVNIIGVTHDRIRVVPLGIDSHFFEALPPGDPPPEPYILFVGNQEPRKNLERLQNAVAILRGRGFPHVLVVAGAGAWGAVSLTQPFVRRLGSVTENELRRLYADAACLALPSLHEGFGLPALEAMAAGTPVVASHAGSLPEVTGGAAVLVDPLDPVDIARGLEAAITDSADLRAGGPLRAAQFTWQRAAEETVAVYRELV